MVQRNIYITSLDKKRLGELIGVAVNSGGPRREDLKALAGELNRAKIVPPQEIPPNVVTMNSKVILRDLETSEEMTYTLVFPWDANADEGAISVLAPIGTAILGYADGDTIEWPVPSGIRRIRIQQIVYQPEAAGDFHR